MSAAPHRLPARAAGARRCRARAAAHPATPLAQCTRRAGRRVATAGTGRAITCCDTPHGPQVQATPAGPAPLSPGRAGRVTRPGRNAAAASAGQCRADTITRQPAHAAPVSARPPPRAAPNAKAPNAKRQQEPLPRDGRRAGQARGAACRSWRASRPPGSACAAARSASARPAARSAGRLPGSASSTASSLATAPPYSARASCAAPPRTVIGYRVGLARALRRASRALR